MTTQKARHFENLQHTEMMFKVYKNAIQLEVSYLKTVTHINNKQFISDNQSVQKKFDVLFNNIVNAKKELNNNYYYLSQIIMKHVFDNSKNTNKTGKLNFRKENSLLEEQLEVCLRIGKSLLNLGLQAAELHEYSGKSEKQTHLPDPKALINPWWMNSSGEILN